MRRTVYKARRRKRGGVAGGLALLVIGGAVAGVSILSGGRGGDEAEALAARLSEQRRPPAELVSGLARAHRIVVLGDIHGHAGAKRTAADVIVTLAQGSGLDAVALEVDSDLQPVIDLYLATTPEDASILLNADGVLNEAWGTGGAYLDLYRTVWRVNRELGADRSIRLIAVDLPDWPPGGALSPADAAERYGRRDAHMAAVLDSAVLVPTPRARVLAFVGGYHALRGVDGLLRAGGGDPIRIGWLASRLRARYPGEVVNVLMDAAARPGAHDPVASYAGTRFYDMLRGQMESGAFGVPVGRGFDFARQPVPTHAGPGLELEFTPDDYRMSDVADGYIMLDG
ncbi:MAG: hypothetical protein ACRELV_03000 [Longimicrobiales bacterium]